MANKLVSIRVPKNLLQETNNVVEEQGFTSVQEFVRTAWREKLDRLKRKKFLEQSKFDDSDKSKLRKELEEYINID